MNRLFQTTSLLLISMLGATGYGQTQPSTQSSPPAASPQAPKAALGFGLEDGTPVKLRITRTISSADSKTGERVDFEVLEDVKFGETVIVPRGGIALATITEAEPKRRLARGGKLNVNIDSVRLASGEKAALRAVKEVSGGGHTGAMTGAMVATSIVFFPAAPFFLFIKGKDITIPKGTEITAYINGDISLDPKKFAPLARANEQAAPASPEAQAEQAPFFVDPEFSSVTIKSVPFEAEISVDGKFVGNTPSTVRLKSGDHKISIKQAGYALWERTITLSAGGNITVNATLEKTP
ncbi:MAG TPA: PEGA domain-containing protein [Blastocatellia bacterium]|nr:PEGA domain-containing protein [Blastocatellia bacterium]